MNWPSGSQFDANLSTSRERKEQYQTVGISIAFARIEHLCGVLNTRDRNVRADPNFPVRAPDFYVRTDTAKQSRTEQKSRRSGSSQHRPHLDHRGRFGTGCAHELDGFLDERDSSHACRMTSLPV
jgi:hypothetical protein